MRNLILGLIIPSVIALVCVDGNPGRERAKRAVAKDEVCFFEGEVKPEKHKPCFNGAYYRKAVSSNDVWLGISGTVVLPKITFDQSRKNTQRPGQYLDNPSIYMGGCMNGQETDIGLTWGVVKDEHGKISAERKAFRPFLRRTAFAATGQKDLWQDAPAKKEFYWYPGEEVSMSIQVVSDGKLKFIVAGAGKRFEIEFESDGYKMKGIAEFKRVNAIDQVRNEGKPAQPTKTRVENAVWKKTSLFRMEEGEVIEVPMHEGRFTDMRCPDTQYFKIKANKRKLKIGAESISINGDPGI